ncbi:uncharacterized protein LOC144121140 isoform X1 [Amblyomma americanum]
MFVGANSVRFNRLKLLRESQRHCISRFCASRVAATRQHLRFGELVTRNLEVPRDGWMANKCHIMLAAFVEQHGATSPVRLLEKGIIPVDTVGHDTAAMHPYSRMLLVLLHFT